MDQRSIQFEHLLNLLVQGLPPLPPTPQIVEEVDGLGKKGSRDITMLDVQAQLEAVLNMPLRWACNFRSWNFSP